jgi:hypothetical protein
MALAYGCHNLLSLPRPFVKRNNAKKTLMDYSQSQVVVLKKCLKINYATKGNAS